MTLPQIDDSPRAIPPYHVIIHFGAAISGDVQGRAMLHLERYFRESLGIPVEVFKQTKADDLKRRRDMTKEQRDNL